jgi:RHS repeat-associated protein
VWKVYYYAGAQMVAMRELSGPSGNTLYYLHGDHLGSTSAVTCGNSACGTVGAVLTRQSYYPYGGVRQAGNLPTDITFTGQRSDAGIGLLDFKARAYSPTLGRFISADSIVPGAGNPQKFNRYTFVLNNPLKYTDPTGHREDDGCQVEGCTWSVTGERDEANYYYQEALNWYQTAQPWGEHQSSDDNWIDLGFDWLLENGPELRYFDSNDAMTQSLMSGRGVQQARDAYYTARTNGKAPPVGQPFRHHYDFGPYEFVMAWLPPNGTSHFLGSYDVYITDMGDGTLDFQVKNVTNWASATNLRVPGTEAPWLSEELRPTGSHDAPMPTLTVPFHTVLPGWQRGDTFYGSVHLGGAFTQVYMWNEPLTVSPGQP